MGAGTGIITKSVAMMVVEDRNSGKRAATFPAEGPFQGGFCGWGLYTPEIAENLRMMKEELFPPLRRVLERTGGLPIKPILAESMQMGDENHTRQTAADLLFTHKNGPPILEEHLPQDILLKVMRYIVETPRFFHCFGQAAARSALLAASNIPYSTMVTAVGGNALEYGIKLSGTGGAVVYRSGSYDERPVHFLQYTEKDQLPWIGDSCVVECAGMGGLAAAASPIVCNLRG